MRDSWLSVVDFVLRPARPGLERCLRERAPHLAARRLVAEGRSRSLADCERRIEAARAGVFAANDGVVTGVMTALEKEWRLLSRVDRDGGVMDLWARIAPAAWLDRKMWRGAAPDDRVDVAIALAADVDGVEAAESAVAALRLALAAKGIAIGASIQYQRRPAVDEVVAPAWGTASAPDPVVESVVRGRFPDRPALARDVAYAAALDIRPLAALYRTGYALSAMSEAGVVLEVPPLEEARG